MSDDLFSTEQDAGSPFKLGTVGTVASGGVTVQWAGDNTASSKVYQVIESYYPQADDNIVALSISGTYLVLGTYGAPKAQPDYIPLNQKAAANGVASLDANGQVVQKAKSAATADTASTAATATTATTATNATNATNATYANYAERMQSSGGYVSSLSSSATLNTVIETVNSVMDALDTLNIIN